MRAAKSTSSQVYSLYIINKAGGLIFQKSFEFAELQSSDSLVVLGGLFYGLHTISSEISPLSDSSGIQELESCDFKLYCLDTATMTKFFIVCSPSLSGARSILSEIYELYADYVLKNPFYVIDQPIRCEKFDYFLDELMKKY